MYQVNRWLLPVMCLAAAVAVLIAGYSVFGGQKYELQADDALLGALSPGMKDLQDTASSSDRDAHDVDETRDIGVYAFPRTSEPVWTVDTQDFPTMSSPAAIQNTLPRYILGLFEGYVAVYDALLQDGNNIITVTDTLAESLSAYERQCLMTGINLYDDEQLARAMQDYGS